VAADPIATLEARPTRHPRLPPPPQIYGDSRRNSTGRDLSIASEREALIKAARDLPKPAPVSDTPDFGENGVLAGFANWNARGGAGRAAVRAAMADAREQNAAALIALTAGEAGRNLQDSIDEVREAVDFLRYYAAEARRLFAGPPDLPSPAGETDQLELHG